MTGPDHPSARRRPLGRRFALALGLLTLVSLVVISAVQMAFVYLSAVDAQRSQLDAIGHSVVPSLAEAAWQADPQRIRTVVDGLARQQGVASLHVVTDSGPPIQIGRRADSPTFSSTFALTHVVGSREYDVGHLEVQLDDADILAQVRSRSLQRVILLVPVVLALIVAIYALIENWVARPLRHVARYARRLRSETLDVPLSLDRAPSGPRDELDDVASSIERMRMALLADLKVKEAYAAELLAHQAGLEELVEQRTRELEDAMAALARERDTAQQLADTDHLTGAMSRRHFEQCLERDAAIARRDGRPLSLLIVDVDHFKRINDTLGHATGDDVLRALVGAFQERLRGTDCIGRLGGEEFAVSLPATDMGGASALADQLRRAIEANGFLRDDGTRVPVTVSVGVSTLDGSGVATLCQRADDALYRAKHEGRNRVVAGNAAG